MFRLVVSSASSPPASTGTGSCSSSTSRSKVDTAAMARRLQRRGFYMAFVLLLALLGATTSHSKIIELICQHLGKQNSCEVRRGEKRKDKAR